ncbi:unnamed protein product [Schistosoma mattheei]|uniref:Uncharacterized protein n=1 Tax=Schistosoma mattheei TaxID=31246 RepID=A0A183NKY0_9TREM|nr:unnamed protein product [Schistosoma mattheei]
MIISCKLPSDFIYDMAVFVQILIHLEKFRRHGREVKRQWFQALDDILDEKETTMRDYWEWIKEELTSTCQEVLGLEKFYHKQRSAMDTLDRIQERKKNTAINNSRTGTEKDKAQDGYIEADKQVMRGIQTDMQKRVEELAMMEERTARERHI